MKKVIRANLVQSMSDIYKFGLLVLELVANRRVEEFELGETGFIEHMRMHYPGSLNEVIDERMNLTEDMFEQAKLGVSLGLMCTDKKARKIPSLDYIHHMIGKVYSSYHVSSSENHRRSHGRADVGQRHSSLQCR